MRCGHTRRRPCGRIAALDRQPITALEMPIPDVLPIRRHRYATTDHQDYEVVSVTLEMIARTRAHPHQLATWLLRGRPPLVYTHQGDR